MRKKFKSDKQRAYVMAQLKGSYKREVHPTSRTDEYEKIRKVTAKKVITDDSQYDKTYFPKGTRKGDVVHIKRTGREDLRGFYLPFLQKRLIKVRKNKLSTKVIK